MKNERILLISDTHLGSDSKVDNFGEEKELMLINLDVWARINNIDTKIIIGDVYELWQGKGWTERRRLKRIKKRYSHLLEALQMSGWISIAGNHDWYMHQKYNNPDKIVIEVTKGNKIRRYLFIHGHQFDKVYKNSNTFIGRLGTEFWGFIEGLIGTKTASKILPWLERYIIKSRGNGRDSDEKDFYNSLESYMSLHKEIDCVFVGHTHTPMLHVGKTTFKYCNTGTWIDDHQDAILLDTKKERVALINCTNGTLKKSFDELIMEGGIKL